MTRLAAVECGSKMKMSRGSGCIIPMGSADMTDRMEGIFSAAASIMVLFTAMLDPRVSAGLAFVLLLGMGIYKLAWCRSAD